MKRSGIQRARNKSRARCSSCRRHQEEKAQDQVMKNKKGKFKDLNQKEQKKGSFSFGTNRYIPPYLD